jgi:hypothetical protein
MHHSCLLKHGLKNCGTNDAMLCRHLLDPSKRKEMRIVSFYK